MGKRTRYKKRKAKREKRARKKDRNRCENWKEVQILAYVHVYLSENVPLLVQNSFLAILMLIGRKPVQKRGMGEKDVSFSTR